MFDFPVPVTSINKENDKYPKYDTGQINDTLIIDTVNHSELFFMLFYINNHKILSPHNQMYH